MTPKDVRHRYAVTASDVVINVFDKSATDEPLCIECRRPMIAKRGDRTQWHFAHKSDPNASCSAETVVHRLAKRFICEGFKAAIADERPYIVQWPCFRCRTLHELDCARTFTEIEPEGRPIVGIRSDLLLRGQRLSAVEVVVTHDIDSDTAERYFTAQIPVFVIRPTWDTLENLRTMIAADELRFAYRRECPGCQQLDELAKRQDVEEWLARIRASFAQPGDTDKIIARLESRDWRLSKDKRGKELDTATQEAIKGYAASLFRLGFTRFGKRRGVLRRQLALGRLFADFRGTKDVPTADDPRPYLYFQLNTRIIGESPRILIKEELQKLLTEGGIPYRFVWISPESEQAGWHHP